MATIAAHDLDRLCRARGCTNVRDGDDDFCAGCRAANPPTPPPDRVPTLPVDRLGLTIDAAELEEGDALALLRRLVTAHEGVAWAIGDVLAAKFQYGTKQRFAVDELGLTEAQAQHWPYVARSVTRENRRPELSWTHHRLVAPLLAAEQADWLDRAVAGAWSVGRLEHELRRSLIADEQEAPDRPAKRPARSNASGALTIKASDEQLGRWRAAAESRGWSLARLVREAVDAYLAAA